MRKSIIFGGSILCLFILLMIPNISAMQYQIREETIKSSVYENHIFEKLKDIKTSNSADTLIKLIVIIMIISLIVTYPIIAPILTLISYPFSVFFYLTYFEYSLITSLISGVFLALTIGFELPWMIFYAILVFLTT